MRYVEITNHYHCLRNYKKSTMTGVWLLTLMENVKCSFSPSIKYIKEKEKYEH